VPARGPADFGWDPVFLPDGFDTTYAETDKDIKNTISHRWGGYGCSYLLSGAGELTAAEAEATVAKAADFVAQV
jgi:hypothetical protein